MDNIFSAFSARKHKLDTLRQIRETRRAGAAEPCPGCGKTVRSNALKLCPRCGYHYRISAKERIEALLDEPRPLTAFDGIVSQNPLDFPGYDDKLAAEREKNGLSDAFYCCAGKLGGYTVLCLAMEPSFMMGSMGAAVGEAVTRAFELAQKKRIPLIVFSASGGARMQEGMFSLMQMAKTAAAARDFSDDGGLYISVLTNPTTGGVTASFAMLGDIIIAEPGALIGFAGPRVIEQTTGVKLPEGFQSAEFQLSHGFIDAVVSRDKQKSALARLLALHGRAKR